MDHLSMTTSAEEGRMFKKGPECLLLVMGTKSSLEFDHILTKLSLADCFRIMAVVKAKSRADVAPVPDHST